MNRRTLSPPPALVFSGLVALFFCASTDAIANGNQRVRFSYLRAIGAERCPNAEVVRDAVTTLLGYDPFDASAGASVVAEVEPASPGLRARVRMVNESGEQGVREILSPRNDCDALAAAMELAIGIAVDPIWSVVSSDRLPKKSSAPLEAPLVVSPSSQVVEPLAAWAGVSGLVALGAAPGTAYGAIAHVNAARGVYSLGLEGRTDLPASVAVDGGSVKSALLAGSLVPCLHSGVLAGCALFVAGALRAGGQHLAELRAINIPYLATGARLQADWSISQHFGIRAQADLLVPLTHTRLLVGSDQAWALPVLSVALGFGVVARIW